MKEPKDFEYLVNSIFSNESFSTEDKNNGYHLRATIIDGAHQGLFENYDTTRVNVEVMGNLITKIDSIW